MAERTPAATALLDEAGRSLVTTSALGTQLHVGVRAPDPALLDPVRAGHVAFQPEGGVWTASYLADGRGSAFVQCVQPWRRLPPHAWLLEPRADIRVLEIDSRSDLRAVGARFGWVTMRYQPNTWPRDQLWWWELTQGAQLNTAEIERTPNWDAIADAYDGVHLTARGTLDCRGTRQPRLLGWEHESTHWYRWCFDSIEQVSTSRFRRPCNWHEYFAAKQVTIDEAMFVQVVERLEGMAAHDRQPAPVQRITDAFDAGTLMARLASDMANAIPHAETERLARRAAMQIATPWVSTRTLDAIYPAPGKATPAGWPGPGSIFDTHRPHAAWFGTDAESIHGLGHAARVLIHANAIAESMIADGVSVDGEAVRWAAVLHDIGRVQDGEDPEHGIRSREWFVQHQPVRMPGLSERQQRLVAGAIRWHVPDDDRVPESERTPEWTCLKDADGLDRVRLGDLDPRYLRTDQARSRVELARSLFLASQSLQHDVGDAWNRTRSAALAQGSWR